MKGKATEPIVGFLLTILSWETINNIILSFVIAFVGGVAAYLARLLCERYLRHRIIKTTTHEKNTDK